MAILLTSLTSSKDESGNSMTLGISFSFKTNSSWNGSVILINILLSNGLMNSKSSSVINFIIFEIVTKCVFIFIELGFWHYNCIVNGMTYKSYFFIKVKKKLKLN